VPRQLLSGAMAEVPAFEKTMKLGNSRWLSGASPLFFIKLINVLGAQGWYYQQIFNLADGGRQPLRRGLLASLCAYLWDEWTTAWRMRQARRRG
jgi:hypothetical protein